MKGELKALAVAGRGASGIKNLMKGELKGPFRREMVARGASSESHEGRIERASASRSSLKCEALESHEGRIERQIGLPDFTFPVAIESHEGRIERF